MNELSKLVVSEDEEIKISGRELHMFLEVKTLYKDWFPRMCEYGFTENVDFNVLKNERVQNEGGREVHRAVTDHLMTVDMAKEISMLQRTEKGKQARQYFIQLEKDWNSPEKVMARALVMAKKKLASVTVQLDTAHKTIEEQKPKVLFADAVTASNTSILIGELAKLLKQNGVEMGAKRLFEYLRQKGYLIKSGTSKNMPTQRAMEMKLFEIKESCIATQYGTRINRTTKVTGKGQVYFINQFKNKLKGIQAELVI